MYQPIVCSRCCSPALSDMRLCPGCSQPLAVPQALLHPAASCPPAVATRLPEGLRHRLGAGVSRGIGTVQRAIKGVWAELDRLR